MSTLEGPIDIDAFRSIYLLHQAADAAREFAIREVLDRFALSWTQFEVLWNIWIFGEREAGWIARAAMVSKSGLTTIFDRLERRGFIDRRIDPTDRRKCLVKLSDVGASHMTEVFSQLNQADSTFASALSDQQKRQLSELLGLLLNGPYAQAYTA